MEGEKRNTVTHSETPSVHLYVYFLFFFASIPLLIPFFHPPLLGTRRGENGDTVAFWEQRPDAVWVFKAELQHQ